MNVEFGFDLNTVLKVKETKTSGGTRTRSPRLRRPMHYPLGHGGLLIRLKVHVLRFVCMGGPFLNNNGNVPKDNSRL